MNHLPTILSLTALLLCAGPPAQGATAEVSYANEARFTDAGTSSRERSDNLAQLAKHLQGLAARHLPKDQTLTIELLDVDLAGASRPSRRAGSEVRVLRGRADWPRIELRYTLSGPGESVRGGQEAIADMDYLGRIQAANASEALSHEKRMLDDWFNARFVKGRDAN